MRVLCFVGAVRAVTMFNGAMLQALGRPHQQAMLSWLFAALSAGAFVIAGLLLQESSASDQVLGMAISRAVLYGVVILGIQAALVRRVCGMGFAQQARALAPSTLAALAALGAGWTVEVTGVLEPLAAGAELVVVGGVAGVAAMVVLVLVEPRARGFARQAAAMGRRRRGRHRPEDAAAAKNAEGAGVATSVSGPLSSSGSTDVTT